MNKLIMLLVVSLAMLGCNIAEINSLEVNGKSFNLEVVDNSAERAQGLMFRSYLPQESGMFFMFPIEDKHGFWMKNTLIPLDIIWISEALEVVHVEKDVQPCKGVCESIKPSQNAKYVLEINAGLSEEYGIKVGDRVEIK